MQEVTRDQPSDMSCEAGLCSHSSSCGSRVSSAGMGRNSIKTSHGRSPSVNKKTGGTTTETPNNQVQVMLSTMVADTPSRGVSFQEYIGVMHAKIDSGMRPCACGERRRPVRKPKDWMSTDEARMTTDVRDHHRAIR